MKTELECTQGEGFSFPPHLNPAKYHHKYLESRFYLFFALPIFSKVDGYHVLVGWQGDNFIFMLVDPIG